MFSVKTGPSISIRGLHRFPVSTPTLAVRSHKKTAVGWEKLREKVHRSVYFQSSHITCSQLSSWLKLIPQMMELFYISRFWKE